MKYIITESSLRRLVNTYLDSLDFTYQKKFKNDEFFLFLDEKLAFEYRNRPDEDYETLFIKFPFAMKVSSLLGLNIDEVTPMLINWVNKNYGTELSHVQWNWVL